MKKFTILLVFCMIISFVISPIVLADPYYFFDGGSYDYSGFIGNISLGNETTVNVLGDLEGNIIASGKNTFSEITGSVYSDSTAVTVSDNASIIVGEDIIVSGKVYTGVNDVGEEWSEYIPGAAIYAYKNASVHVGGDVSSLKNAYTIHASFGSSVEIDGKINGGYIDINSNDSHLYAGSAEVSDIIIDGDNSSIEVKGELNAAHNIYINGVNSHVSSNGGTISGAVVNGENTSLTGIGKIEAEGLGVALEVGNGASADINGDVAGDIGETNTYIDSNGTPHSIHTVATAVHTYNNGTVSIHGDVTIGKEGDSTEQDISLSAYNDSIITVDGNVIGGQIRAEKDSTISIIEGNVNVDQINASNGSTVSITNNVNAGMISVSEDSKVSVGSGTATHVSVTGENSSLIGITDVESEDNPTMGGNVNVANGGTIEISGNVVGGDGFTFTFRGKEYYAPSTAITGNNKAMISVGGDVTVAEGGTITTISEDGGIRIIKKANTAIDVTNNTTVSVGGSVTVGTVDSAIKAYYGSTVNVEGEVNGGGIIVSDRYPHIGVDENGNLAIVTDSGEGSHVAVGGGTISSAEVTGDGSTLTGVTNVVSDERETAVRADGDVFVSIENDISANEGSGIIASHKATVEVGNGILSKEIAIEAFDESEVSIDGNVVSDEYGIIADNSSIVNVQGNVESGNTGIMASNKATVEVGNDIISKQTAIEAFDESEVSINGNVVSEGNSIIADNSSIVNVQGNVESGNTGIEVYLTSENEENGTIVVNGTVDAKNKAVEIQLVSESDPEDVLSAMPHIIVQTLESEKDLVVVTAPSATEKEKEALTDALVSNLYYIVNTDGIDQTSIAVYGTEVVDGYVVAKENSTITLKSTQEGYIVCQVEAGNYATITENEDGSYSIIVERGGDLNLKASVTEKPADEPENPDDPSIPVNPGNQDNPANPDYSSSTDDTQKPEKPDNPYNPIIPVNTGRQNNPMQGRSWDNPWITNISVNPANNDKPINGINQSQIRGWGSDKPILIVNPDGLDNPVQSENWGNLYITNTSANPTNNDKLITGINQNQIRGWDPAYALSPDYNNMMLVINLIGRQELCILRTDLENFQSIGFETVNIVTENDSMYMAMTNLIELYANANQCMFARNGNSVELWVMNSIVFTITLVKDEKNAA